MNTKSYMIFFIITFGFLMANATDEMRPFHLYFGYMRSDATSAAKSVVKDAIREGRARCDKESAPYLDAKIRVFGDWYERFELGESAYFGLLNDRARTLVDQLGGELNRVRRLEIYTGGYEGLPIPVPTREPRNRVMYLHMVCSQVAHEL